MREDALSNEVCGKLNVMIDDSSNGTNGGSERFITAKDFTGL